MNIVQIEKNLQKLMKSYQKETFIYDLLLAYGLPKASITRLQKGNLNLSKVKGELSWKKKVFFKEEFEKDLHVTLLDLAEETKHDQRFVIVTDYNLLLAIDTKTKDKLDVDFKDLAKNYDFFLPWAGMEKTQHQNENPADVKAAERMAKLFDEIKKDNPKKDQDFNHGLNVFLSRLLFCFFAEDTDIFEDNQFTNAIGSHTQADGSDLGRYLDDLFQVLNTPDNERKGLPTYLEAFPYVNGGLFRQRHSAPEFSRKSRQLIIEAGELNWKDINPDIFGSMFQGVIDPGKRGSLGAHYTSVPNIMKVIEPLFLEELYEAYDKAKGNSKRISELLHRLSQIKIFDPACGSGNFLIIAYKELRRLEMKIFREHNMMAFSQISLSQFYGIELDDFAHEIAQLSLWLAEHQMNVEFFKQFGRTNPTLPLKEAGKIVCGNACRLNWFNTCFFEGNEEVYILGNPPYLGYARQNKDQKEDMAFVFSGIKDYKKLDYIAAWFYKASKFIKTKKQKAAFVSTNSVTQGEQVSLLWKNIFDLEIEINFAYKSFKWINNAKDKAGVTVVIIGISKDCKIKSLIDNTTKRIVEYINPYLVANSKTIVAPFSKSISGLPVMIKGSSPGDGGNLLIDINEFESLIETNPQSKKYLKKYVGANEFLNKTHRYCIYVTDEEYETAKSIEQFNLRFNKVKQLRLNSKKAATRLKAETPYRFDEDKYQETTCVIFPQTTSENRVYVPIGFLDESYVVSNAARVIYNAELWMFSILTSRMHNVWLQAVAGRLETRIQYSNTLCYNTFPVPELNDRQKEQLNNAALKIISVRESYSDISFSDLYHVDKIPEDLLLVHQENDQIIDKIYKKTPFMTNEQRLEFLFSQYENKK